MATRILSVTRGPSGVWRIRTDDRNVYATKNGWLASLADRYRAAHEQVEMESSSGWFYRELSGIRLITEQKAS
jgi:hypothetical protein